MSAKEYFSLLYKKYKNTKICKYIQVEHCNVRIIKCSDTSNHDNYNLALGS